MSRLHHPFATPAGLLQALSEHRRRWLVPAAAVAGIVACYAVFRGDTWEARQALIVRNEAAGNNEGPGEFRQPEELKSTEETIIEIGRSPGVLGATLFEVGPPDGNSADPSWPSRQDVSEFASAVRFSPPKGAELGSTEVFYITVEDQESERAVRLAGTLGDQLVKRFNQMRDERAQSMITELDRAVALAQQDLASATKQLTALESEVGTDLSELRNLTLSTAGESDLRQKVLAIESDLRTAEQSVRGDEELLSLLTAAQKDADKLLATPNRLLESQPALRKLKEGLVDAQLRTAQLSGSRTDQHPQVVAAKKTEAEVRSALQDEIEVAITGVKSELQLSTHRVEDLKQQLADGRARVTKLSGMRAHYSTLAAEVEHRTKLVADAQSNLAAARSKQASAQSASLISRLDSPDVGSQPIGPSRALTVLFGIGGGFLVGFGVLFLTIELTPQVGSASTLSTQPSKQAPAHAETGGRRDRSIAGTSRVAADSHSAHVADEQEAVPAYVPAGSEFSTVWAPQDAAP